MSPHRHTGGARQALPERQQQQRLRPLWGGPRQRRAEELSWEVSERRGSRMQRDQADGSVCREASELVRGHTDNEHGRRGREERGVTEDNEREERLLSFPVPAGQGWPPKPHSHRPTGKQGEPQRSQEAGAPGGSSCSPRGPRASRPPRSCKLSIPTRFRGPEPSLCSARGGSRREGRPGCPHLWPRGPSTCRASPCSWQARWLPL